MWETYTIDGVELEFERYEDDYIDYCSYPAIIEFNYKPEELGNISSIKLDVGYNIFATLDVEYMTGDVLKQAEEVVIEYIEGLKSNNNH